MKKIFLLSMAMLSAVYSMACTNVIVGKKASADGSVICSYNADSWGMYGALCHYPAAKHAKGEMRQIRNWDNHAFHGEIPEAAETYNVVGNMNEYQLTINETTFEGRIEMVDTLGLIDYGSLIYIALQRCRTAREAISVMTSLVEKYGYNSEGETFSICDPNEAWIMEMMGCGSDRKKSKERVLWVAVRIPDDAICCHANQSRIRTFNQKDKENVLYSKNVIKFARTMGWFDGKDADFSFRDAYAYPDFSGRRFCDARVWSVFNHFTDMSEYIDYAAGIKPVGETKEMPLYIVPNKKVSVQDVKMLMRDHFENTPFALDNDMGGGIWQTPYRPSPLTFKVDGKEYFNERPISGMQTAWGIVCQMRSWMPREVGGVIWFGNDDPNMVAYVPVYTNSTKVPKCFVEDFDNWVKFSTKNAYWLCNMVSNMVYPRYSLLFPELQSVRDSLENDYMSRQREVEEKALKLYSESPAKAVDYLTKYSGRKAGQMMDTWRKLAETLIVKYNDMTTKPVKNGKYEMTKYGIPVPPKRPGYSEKVARMIVNQTGKKFLVPSK